MLYFMLGGPLFYHRTLIFVPFLLFLVMTFHFFNTGVVIFLFLLISLCPSYRGNERLQKMMIMSRYHGNNQDSIYELSVVFVEEIKV